MVDMDKYSETAVNAAKSDRDMLKKVGWILCGHLLPFFVILLLGIFFFHDIYYFKENLAILVGIITLTLPGPIIIGISMFNKKTKFQLFKISFLASSMILLVVLAFIFEYEIRAFLNF